jgi:Fe-S cluster biogenesis protein NfuA
MVAAVVLDETIPRQLEALEQVVKVLQEETKPQLTVQQGVVALVR